MAQRQARGAHNSEVIGSKPIAGIVGYTIIPKEILKNEYGMTIKDLFNKNGRWDELKVPEELRTDEWWKKRNL